MGYVGAVMAVGTVAGPLIGGVLTDSLGWRWCFYVGVPVAIAAIAVLQLTLHLPRRRRRVRIDCLGAALLSAGVSLLLFPNRTVVLAVVASVSLGIAMFGTSVFLSQYLQLAKGRSPTSPGLLTIPMVLGGAIGVSALGAVLGEIFLVAAPAGLVALLAILLIKELPLGTRSGIDLAREQRHAPQTLTPRQ
jgi:MFS family permease